MARVLTVDDSKALRTIVSRQLKSMGLDVEAAEDGEKGLEALAAGNFDLVLLDVTMPNLDGPGMLKRMREGGNRTPVIMLTSESKTTVIGECMKLGIEDYILKPFTPDEIREKLVKVLRNVSPEDAKKLEAAGQPEGAPKANVAMDLLVIDDMPNVHAKLRDMLPQTMTIDTATDGQATLQLCREKTYKVILIDSTLPDTDSAALLAQLKILQGSAKFLSLTLRSKLNVEQEALGMGFQGVLFKPFDQDAIADMLANFFDSQNLVSTDGDTIRLLEYSGREVEKYFNKVKDLTKDSLQAAAAACYEAVVFDVTRGPLRPENSIKLILDVHRMARKLGMELRLVGSDEAKKLCGSFTDTAAIPFYDTVENARSATKS